MDENNLKNRPLSFPIALSAFMGSSIYIFACTCVGIIFNWNFFTSEQKNLKFEARNLEIFFNGDTVWTSSV